MVFKRYIYRHGKKLGPYYYENIRGPDGNVKTIYIGTNPRQHPKHRIRKPLFFIILVLVLILVSGSLLFFMQNKAYLIKKVKLQQPDFDVDQILLKVLVKSKESLEKQIRVMNTGSELASISIEASGLSDIVKTDAPSFAIKPGQTKIVALNFSSFDEQHKIEQQPGIYIGKLIVKSEKAAKEIPVIAEIETKNVLFDLNLNPIAFDRRIEQGTETTIEVRLFNLESIESTNVDVDYFVKDINGNTIVTESETVVVKTQASFFKTISVPKNLKPGSYVFGAQTKFGNSVGTSSYLFEVVGPEQPGFSQFCRNNVLCLGLSATTVLLLFALMAYFYFFIGAYLYEKFTGTASLPEKKNEDETGEIEKIEDIEEEPEPGIIEMIKAKLDAWKKEKEEARLEKQKRKREEELRELANERKKALERKIREPSAKLRTFYRLVEEAREALGKNDFSKIDRIYKEERRLYANLPLHEKQEIYDKMIELHNQRNKLLELKKRHEEEIREEESRKQKELERQKAEKEREEAIKKELELKKQRELEEKRRKEEQKKRRELEKERHRQQIKQKWKEFLHRIGLYKTPEEKRLIALEKEKERQEKQRRKEEIKKQKEIERARKEQLKLAEEKKRKEEKIAKEADRKRQQLEEEKRKQEDARKQEELRKKLGLEKQKAEEERRKRKEQERMQKELLKQKQGPRFGFLKNFISRYKQKIQEWRKEKEKRKAILETAKRVKEELKQKKKKEKKAKEETKPEGIGLLGEEIKRKQDMRQDFKVKPSWFEKLFKKDFEPKAEEIKEPKEAETQKPRAIGSLFGKIIVEKPAEKKPTAEEIKEEKPRDTKSAKTEADELEDAIRSLDLFKRIEKGSPGISEKKPGVMGFLKKLAEEMPKEKTEKKSKIEQFHKAFSEAKEHASKNDIARARKLYIESRNIYVDLSTEEKKKVYGEFTEFYNKISK